MKHTSRRQRRWSSGFLRVGQSIGSTLLFGGVLSIPALAQDPPVVAVSNLPDSLVVDRVVAIVGDSAILLSEVQAEILTAQSAGQNAQVQEVLELLIERQLILQAAALDSTMVVTNDQIAPQVDASLARIQQGFGGEDGFRRALVQDGQTLDSYRDWVRERIRDQQIQELFMRRQVESTPSPAVTEAEMRTFFEERRAELQERPEALTLQQVFFLIVPSDSAKQVLRAKADSLYQLLREGADFDSLAAEHSDDPGTAQNGGDLGWFRRGTMVREFEAVAFRMGPGSVSLPVESNFGYHVIKVERARPGEVKARHILVAPSLTPEDRVRTRDRAEAVAERARQGSDMLELYAEEGDPDQPLPEEFGISRVELTQLPYQGYAENLAGVTEGDVVGPFQVRVRADEYFVVVKVKDVREAGEFTFEDLREQIRDGLVRQKKVERILERLRSQTFVEIRM